MSISPNDAPRLPAAPHSIRKGVPLADLLGPEAVDCLAHNLRLAWPQFQAEAFREQALCGLEGLALLERGRHLAQALRLFLPERFAEAAALLVRSLTPPLRETEGLGLGVFFYLPHVRFVAEYGLDPAHNGGQDPFEAALSAQYELTRRFSAEFSLRPFLERWPERTLARLQEWTRDPDPHVRRLCSEGTRPRLPWAPRLAAFARVPSLALPLLEALKDDPSPYVRRSVANHLGDLAKEQPAWVFALCERWLAGASPERRALLRHALRHPARRGVEEALRLRARCL